MKIDKLIFKTTKYNKKQNTLIDFFFWLKIEKKNKDEQEQEEDKIRTNFKNLADHNYLQII